MTVRCLFCQKTYSAQSGRSVCPSCDRAQQHTSMANFILPVSSAGRIWFVLVMVVVVLVIAGWLINLQGG